MKRAHAIVVALLAAVFTLALGACSAQGSGSASSSVSDAPSSAASSSVAPIAATPDVVTIPLDYNAGTGFEWQCTIEPEGVVSKVGMETEDMAAGQNVSGGPLRDLFTFKAEKPGEVTITFDLARSWEEGDPAETQVYAFVVGDDLKMTLNPYKSNFNNEPEWVSGS